MPTALSHAPSSLTLNYNSNTELVNVTITHIVDNVSTHYIGVVEIRVNGTTVKTEYYINQPSLDTFTYQYNVTANNGGRIEVTARCSIGGFLTTCIVVGEGLCPESIPGYLGFWLIMMISVISLLILIRRKMKK